MGTKKIFDLLSFFCPPFIVNTKYSVQPANNNIFNAATFEAAYRNLNFF